MTKSYPKPLLEVIIVTGDGHCILHAVREAMRHENVKAIPSNSELLTMIKFEVLNNLDYHGKFISSAYCVKSFQIRSFFWSVFSHIRTKYGETRSISTYSVRMRENTDQKKLRIWSNESDTNDLVLRAISNLLKCNIMLLREDPEEFFLECGDNHITAQRDICTASFTIT